MQRRATFETHLLGQIRRLSNLYALPQACINQSITILSAGSAGHWEMAMVALGKKYATDIRNTRASRVVSEQ